MRVDVPFHASLLDAISAARDLLSLRRAHARIVSLGLAPHHFLRSKLCAAYARCSRLPEAHLLLSFASRRPAFLLNALLRASPPLHALHLFRRMLASADPRSFAAALSAAAALPSLPLARATHALALAAGAAPSPVVATSLVSAYSKCGDLPLALRVFDETTRRGTRSLGSFTAMVCALGAHGRSPEAVALFWELAGGAAGATPDAAAVTAALAACARGGLVAEGRRVFEMAREGRFGGPTVEHYTCMVDLLGRAGHVEEAEALIGDMGAVEPDEALWGALLGACRVHGWLDVAERVANRGGLRFGGLSPNTGPLQDRTGFAA